MRFNPRAPRGARRGLSLHKLDQVSVSIHAPLAGRDAAWLLVRRGSPVSIHAPLAGRDEVTMGRWSTRARVSIHAPLAGRDAAKRAQSLAPQAFQSTRPSRGATSVRGCPFLSMPFQSTRPSRGATCRRMSTLFITGSFQSTRPSRGATVSVVRARIVVLVSIHAPLAGRDEEQGPNLPLYPCFNPRAPRGARLAYRLSNPGVSNSFNPRAPRGARLHISYDPMRG